MNKTDDDQSNRGDDCIHESNNRLCLKYKPESSSHLFCYDRPLFVEKSEISIFQLSKKFFYPFSIDDEEVGEDKSNEKFRQYDPCIGDISDSFLSYRFEIIWADHLSYEATESEFETRALLDPGDEVFSLHRYIWSLLEKSLDFTSDLREDIHKYEYHYTDKYNIERSDNHISGCILSSEHMCCISFSLDSPCMYLSWDESTEFEKYIWEEECHKKEYEKVT